MKHYEPVWLTLVHNSETWEGYAVDKDITVQEILDGELYETALETIEQYATINNLQFHNEETVSKGFDDLIKEVASAENLLLFASGKDKLLVGQEFSAYLDSLYADGELHMIQVNSYCYVGEFPS